MDWNSYITPICCCYWTWNESLASTNFTNLPGPSLHRWHPLKAGHFWSCLGHGRGNLAELPEHLPAALTRCSVRSWNRQVAEGFWWKRDLKPECLCFFVWVSFKVFSPIFLYFSRHKKGPVLRGTGFCRSWDVRTDGDPRWGWEWRCHRRLGTHPALPGGGQAVVGRLL